MLETLKFLLDVPEKMTGVFIKLAKNIFSLLLASHLYEIFIGKYVLINFTDISAWSEFILSKRILVCIFLYVFSYFILFKILPFFSFIPIKLVSYKIKLSIRIDKDGQNYILWWLDFFELLKVDFKNEKVNVGRHTDEFYEFIEIISSKDGKFELSSIKNSFIENIWHIYLLFTFYYFYFAKRYTTSWWLTFLILAGLILIPIIYAIVFAVFEKLQDNAKDILFEIRGLQTERIILDTLRDLRIAVWNMPPTSARRDAKYFHFDQKEYMIFYPNCRAAVHEPIVKSMLAVAEREKKSPVLLFNTPLHNAAARLLEEKGTAVTVIKYNSLDALVLELKKEFGFLG